MDWLAVLRLGLVIIASSFAGSLVFTYSFRGKIKAKPNEIKPPNICIYIGTFTDAIVLIAIYFCLKNAENMGLIIILIPLALPGFWLILHGCLWRITLYEEKFTFRSSLGRKKEYQYDEIKSYENQKYGSIKLILNKKKIGVAYWCSNMNALSKTLYEKLQKPQTAYVSPKRRKEQSKVKK